MEWRKSKICDVSSVTFYKRNCCVESFKIIRFKTSDRCILSPGHRSVLSIASNTIVFLIICSLPCILKSLHRKSWLSEQIAESKRLLIV